MIIQLCKQKRNKPICVVSIFRNKQIEMYILYAFNVTNIEILFNKILQWLT